MGAIAVIIAIAMIIWEESNRNILTFKQQQKLLELKPLIDRERQLRENLFSGNIFKK